jgi:ceramide glucosyltransferase
VLRAHRPELFPTVPWLLCPTPLLLALALVLHTPLLVGLVLLLVGLRTLLALRLGAGQPDGLETAGAWLLGEGLLELAFLHALLFRTVAWRGRRFRLLPGGRMQARVEPP